MLRKAGEVLAKKSDRVTLSIAALIPPTGGLFLAA